MNIELDKVTWYSQVLGAIFIFGIMPLIVFSIGREYQKTIAVYNDDNTAALLSSGAIISARHTSDYKTPVEATSTKKSSK